MSGTLGSIDICTLSPPCSLSPVYRSVCLLAIFAYALISTNVHIPCDKVQLKNRTKALIYKGILIICILSHGRGMIWYYVRKRMIVKRVIVFYRAYRERGTGEASMCRETENRGLTGGRRRGRIAGGGVICVD